MAAVANDFGTFLSTAAQLCGICSAVIINFTLSFCQSKTGSDSGKSDCFLGHFYIYVLWNVLSELHGKRFDSNTTWLAL